MMNFDPSSFVLGVIIGWVAFYALFLYIGAQGAKKQTPVRKVPESTGHQADRP